MTFKNDEIEVSTDKSVSWDEITNKPTRFAPKDHEHDVLWNEVIGKPTEFTPEYHTHDEYAKRYHRHSVEDIIGLEGLLNSSNGNNGNGGNSTDHNHDDRYYKKSEIDEKLEDLGLVDCYKQYFIDKENCTFEEDLFYIYKVTHSLDTKDLDVKVNNSHFQELLADVTILNNNEIEILTGVEEDLVVLIKKINLINNTWRK